MANLQSRQERLLRATDQLQVWTERVIKSEKNINYAHEIEDMDMSEAWQIKLDKAKEFVSYYEEEIMMLNLLAKVDMCNNGYIFSPSIKEKEIAHAHPETFKVARNTISRLSTFIERRK